MQAQLPYIEQGWGTQYYGTSTVQAFFYDLSKSILYIIYPNNTFTGFSGVPANIAQQFSIALKQLPCTYLNPLLPDPDAIYDQQVIGKYPTV